MAEKFADVEINISLMPRFCNGVLKSKLDSILNLKNKVSLKHACFEGENKAIKSVITIILSFIFKQKIKSFFE